MQPASSPPPTWRDRLDLIAGGVPPGPARLAAAVGGLAAAVVVGWLLLRTPPPPPEDLLPRARPAATSTTAPAVVVAHAAGAVRRPGVYRLEPGARVADLIAAAGGALPGADLDRVNLAARVADGAQVYVPRRGEAGGASAGSYGAAEGPVSGPLDLNSATLEQLDELPGIGPATAKAILDARARLGRFASVDDLLDVRGIGPAKLDAIRDLVTV